MKKRQAWKIYNAWGVSSSGKQELEHNESGSTDKKIKKKKKNSTAEKSPKPKLQWEQSYNDHRNKKLEFFL